MRPNAFYPNHLCWESACVWAGSLGRHDANTKKSPPLSAVGNGAARAAVGSTPPCCDITEFVASNASGIRDAEGDRPDWVEIFNAGNDLVDLSGMYLTDDGENLKEWQFPNGVSLPGGGYLVVFASNKDAVLAGGELHTSFALGADGEFLALVDKDGTTIIDQYAPEFPAQLEDISYGRAMQPIRCANGDTDARRGGEGHHSHFRRIGPHLDAGQFRRCIVADLRADRLGL